MSKIVGVISGPLHSSEIPDWDEREDGFGLPYGEGYVLVVQERDERGVIRVEEVVFEDFDDAMEMVDHFVGQIIPIEWEDTF